MKNTLSWCLGVALLVAVQSTLAAEPAKPAAPAPALAAKGKETPEQKSARHTREAKDAEAKINGMVKEFPLLTGPGWEQHHGTFRTELAKVQRASPSQPLVPRLPKPVLGQAPVPQTPAEFRQQRREAVLATMRQQAEPVLKAHPELRAYVEEQLGWHRRLFELQDEHPDNPKVRQLVQNRLEVVAIPDRRKPATAK